MWLKPNENMPKRTQIQQRLVINNCPCRRRKNLHVFSFKRKMCIEIKLKSRKGWLSTAANVCLCKIISKIYSYVFVLKQKHVLKANGNLTNGGRQ